MMQLLRKCAGLRRDEGGNTLVEFAFVAPVFMVMLIGVFDVAHTLYTSSVLQGTMQKAGRDFTLENSGSQRTRLHAFVTNRVKQIAPSAAIEFDQRAYFDFADVGQPEVFYEEPDTADGICNNNEPFDDANGNGDYDLDRGEVGLGGARDAVLFTATVSYDRLFPMAELIGLPDQVTLTGSTVLRNQPFDIQDRTIPTGNCP